MEKIMFQNEDICDFSEIEREISEICAFMIEEEQQQKNEISVGDGVVKEMTFQNQTTDGASKQANEALRAEPSHFDPKGAPSYLDCEIDFSLPKKKKKLIFIPETEISMVGESSANPRLLNNLVGSKFLNPFESDRCDYTRNTEEADRGEADFKTANKVKSVSQTIDSISDQGREMSEIVETLISKFQGHPPSLDDGLNFSLEKKKRKKKTTVISEIAVPENEKRYPVPENHSASLTTHTDGEYSYEYLLSRVYQKMRDKNPNIDETDRNKLIIKPPQILRIGTKRSSFVNFLELCKIMHRTPIHVQSFLLVELGTNGSIDGNSHLIIKGKFQQKQIESVLRKYIREYVTCHSCHSPNTVLLKETRLYFLKCEACGSQSSVPAVKSGFQAVISKRAAIRTRVNN